jgi:O-antigen ligase
VQERKRYITILVVGSFLLSLYTLRSFFIVSESALHYLEKGRILHPYVEEFLGRQRAFVPFISPNLLGGYLGMIIPLCGGIIFQRMKERKIDLLFILTIICISSCFLVFFLTKSIGAWCSLFLAIMLSGVILKGWNKKIILLSFVFLLFLAGIIFIRFQTLKEFTTPLASLQNRLLYWRQTLGVIGNHPLVGVGIGNFSLRASRFTHNSYLQIWAEMGLLGLISWLGIIVIFFREGIKRLKREKVGYPLGFFVAGLSFILHNLVDFTFFIPQVSFLWWIICGCILSREKITL